MHTWLRIRVPVGVGARVFMRCSCHGTQEWHLFRLAALHGAFDAVNSLYTCSRMHARQRVRARERVKRLHLSDH